MLVGRAIIDTRQPRTTPNPPSRCGLVPRFEESTRDVESVGGMVWYSGESTKACLHYLMALRPTPAGQRILFGRRDKIGISSLLCVRVVPSTNEGLNLCKAASSLLGHETASHENPVGPRGVFGMPSVNVVAACPHPRLCRGFDCRQKRPPPGRYVYGVSKEGACIIVVSTTVSLSVLDCVAPAAVLVWYLLHSFPQ